MSLLTQATLVVTPNAGKTSKLYSVIPSNGNGDFTVTRATTATRVNSAGLVEVVPYNLVTYSEQFNDATWSKINSTITANTTTAPDGTLTADKLVENSINSNHWVFQSNTGAFQSITASCYFKKSERDWGLIRIRTNIDDRYAYFNLNNGTIGTVNAQLTATIQDVGNGWYRCIVTTTAPTTSANPIVFGMSNADNTNSYLGDGTSGLFIWGAQLVEGAAPLTYLPTTTRLNIPRLDYSLGSCPNLLLEPQRTNLALRSEEFDNAVWVKDFSTITPNTTISPSGIQNADTYTGSGGISTTRIIYQSQSVVSGTQYSISVYAKKNTNNFIQLLGGTTAFGINAFANFDLNNGVIGTVGSAATARIENVGNGWYRCIMTAPAIATISSAGGVYSLITSATSVRAEANTLSTSVFLWGAQLEAGAYATSYIPTTTASVTRNADSVSLNNVFTNGLISASGGTWFVEIRNNLSLTRDTVSGGIGLTAVAGGTFQIRSGASANRLLIYKTNLGVNSVIYTTTTDTIKVAFKWNGTTADVFVNGTKVVSATAFNTTLLESLSATGGDVPKNINQMALWATPLTDDQLELLTGDSFNTYAEMASFYNYTLQ